MGFWIECVFAFLALFVTDICWTFYIGRVKEGNAFHAAKWALLLFVAGGYATIGYTKDWRLLIPAALGSFAGTYVAVWVDKRKEEAAAQATSV